MSDGDLKKLLVQRLCLVEKNLDLTDDFVTCLSEVMLVSFSLLILFIY